METLFKFFKTLNINDIDASQQETHQPAEPAAQHNINENNNIHILNDPITESEIRGMAGKFVDTISIFNSK